MVSLSTLSGYAECAHNVSIPDIHTVRDGCIMTAEKAFADKVKAEAKKDEAEVKAEKAGGIFVKIGDTSLHASGPLMAVLKEGQGLQTKAYGYYRKAWPMFLQDAKNNPEVFEPGKPLYKLALRIVKQANPAWVSAEKGYRELAS